MEYFGALTPALKRWAIFVMSLRDKRSVESPKGVGLKPGFRFGQAAAQRWSKRELLLPLRAGRTAGIPLVLVSAKNENL